MPINIHSASNMTYLYWDSKRPNKMTGSRASHYAAESALELICVTQYKKGPLIDESRPHNWCFEKWP